MTTSLLQELLGALTRRDILGAYRRAGGNAQQEATAEEVLAECERLLDSDGEASSIGLARQVLAQYAALGPEPRRRFFHLLRDRLGADRQAVEQAYTEYRRSGDEEALAGLFMACEPRRQELLRRLNLAPEGTCRLVRMREDLLREMRHDPVLGVVDRDFVHLLGSWFNRGFLVLRRIDWETPASILEKIIRYESVHAITDWQDLRRRLDPRDRRCFAFFHPALGDEPLVFVEVALTTGIPSAVQQILHAGETPAMETEPHTAAFFGISSCQFGLRGISFGNFLIKQVVQELQQELPSLRTFVTLSPVPGFTGWLQELRDGTSSGGGPAIPESWRRDLALLERTDWHASSEHAATLRDILIPLLAWYLCREKNTAGYPRDPVARFHLGNGARLERLNWLGDTSEKGLRQGAGLMVNYVYDIDQIERNHEQYANEGLVATARGIRKALGVVNGEKWKTQP